MDALAAQVLADSPLAFWRGALSGSTIADASGNSRTLTLGGTYTVGLAGPLAASNSPATAFDGASGYGFRAMDLSSYRKLALEFWYFDASSAQDAEIIGYTSTPASAGSFIISPMWGGDTTKTIVYHGNEASYSTFLTPSAGAWHHWVLNLDRTIPGGLTSAIIDGAAVATTVVGSAVCNSNFANSTLYLMGRGGESNFVAGRLSNVAIYGGIALPVARAKARYDAGIGATLITAHDVQNLAQAITGRGMGSLPTIAGALPSADIQQIAQAVRMAQGRAA